MIGDDSGTAQHASAFYQLVVTQGAPDVFVPSDTFGWSAKLRVLVNLTAHPLYRE